MLRLVVFQSEDVAVLVEELLEDVSVLELLLSDVELVVLLEVLVLVSDVELLVLVLLVVLVVALLVEVVLAVEVLEVDVVVVVVPAMTVVCACWLFPVSVRMYFCPMAMPCVGAFPCNRAKAPIVIGPL